MPQVTQPQCIRVIACGGSDTPSLPDIRIVVAAMLIRSEHDMTAQLHHCVARRHNHHMRTSVSVPRPSSTVSEITFYAGAHLHWIQTHRIHQDPPLQRLRQAIPS